MTTTGAVRFVNDGEYPMVALAALAHHPENPKQHDLPEIVQSILRNGFYGAMVVQRSTMYVLAGNGRLDALLTLGATHGPVIWLDVDDETARRILLVDNRTTQLAGYDDAALTALLASIAGDDNDARDDNLIGTGYTTNDLDALLAELTHEHDDDGEIEPPATADLHSIYSADAVHEEAFVHWRAHGYPYPTVERYDGMQQINRLAATDTTSLAHTSTANRVADAYHPERFAVIKTGWKPPLALFEDDKGLRRIFTMCDKWRQPINNKTVFTYSAFAAGANAAANFRPGYALHIYRRYANEGATVLDCSAGWGGRLVGFIASNCGTYIGLDPSTNSNAGNQRIVADYGRDDQTYDLRQTPAEDATIDTCSVDLAFTSPPYFNKEQYSDEPTQSWKRYPHAEQWQTDFLQPVLQLQHDALKRGGYAIINIADIQDEQQHTVPLETWTIEAALQAGLTHVDTIRYPLGRVPNDRGHTERHEPVFVFRKE